MAGIGEASAIISTIQVGFILARTLNTYVGDYRDANDDIIALSAQIDATLVQVKELEDLVANNSTVKSLDDGGVKLAAKCKTDSERTLKKLIKILAKAGVPHDLSRPIVLEDINPSRLSQISWPLYKPRVEVVKRELDTIRLEILLARSCIEARSAKTESERLAAKAAVAALARSEVRAKKMLQRARVSERSASRPPPSYASDPADDEGTSRRPLRRPSPVRRNSLNSRTSFYSRRNDSDFTLAEMDRIAEEREDKLLIEQLKTQLKNEIAENERQQKVKAEQEEKARQDAIEGFKRRVIEQVNATRMEAQAAQARLIEAFRGTLTPEQIREFVESRPGQAQGDELVDLLSRMPKADAASVASREVSPPSSLSNVSTSRRSSRLIRSWSSFAKGKRQVPRALPARGRLAAPRQREFIHILLTADEYITYSVLDANTMNHEPCGAYCNFEKSMAIWAGLHWECKRKATRAASTQAPDRTWRLHAVWRAEPPQTGKTRQLLHRALLGSELKATLASEPQVVNVMVVFAADISQTDTMKIGQVTVPDADDSSPSNEQSNSGQEGQSTEQTLSSGPSVEVKGMKGILKSPANTQDSQNSMPSQSVSGIDGPHRVRSSGDPAPVSTINVYNRVHTDRDESPQPRHGQGYMNDWFSDADLRRDDRKNTAYPYSEPYAIPPKTSKSYYIPPQSFNSFDTYQNIPSFDSDGNRSNLQRDSNTSNRSERRVRWDSPDLRYYPENSIYREPSYSRRDPYYREYTPFAERTHTPDSIAIRERDRSPESRFIYPRSRSGMYRASTPYDYDDLDLSRRRSTRKDSHDRETGEQLFQRENRELELDRERDRAAARKHEKAQAQLELQLELLRWEAYEEARRKEEIERKMKRKLADELELERDELRKERLVTPHSVRPSNVAKSSTISSPVNDKTAVRDQDSYEGQIDTDAAEDADLDVFGQSLAELSDERLSHMMLVKYTGGEAPIAEDLNKPSMPQPKTPFPKTNVLNIDNEDENIVEDGIGPHVSHGRAPATGRGFSASPISDRGIGISASPPLLAQPVLEREDMVVPLSPSASPPLSSRWW